VEDCNLNHSESPIGCFGYLTDNELEIIASKKTRVTYLKGETIFKQGAFAPYVLFVIDGLVKIFLQTGGQKQLNLRIARQGDFMAFSSIFGENVYSYSAMALKDTSVCMIDKEALKQLLLSNPEFALRITSRNYQNESRYIDLLHNISYRQMRGKLASALLYLSSAEFSADDVFSCLTRQDIADFASITVESTVKFLKEFEREGLLKVDGRNIEVVDEKRLRNVEKNG
jgi:CRP/FNR family transcriptional regulator